MQFRPSFRVDAPRTLPESPRGCSSRRQVRQIARRLFADASGSSLLRARQSITKAQTHLLSCRHRPRAFDQRRSSLRRSITKQPRRRLRLADRHASPEWPNVSLAARGGVAATIESGVELMLQNALTQFNELVLRRYKKEASENQPGRHGPASGNRATPDFPDI